MLVPDSLLVSCNRSLLPIVRRKVNRLNDITLVIVCDSGDMSSFIRCAHVLPIT